MSTIETAAACVNCRTTERNLARAYIRIGELLDAARAVAVAEDDLRDATAHLKATRIEVAGWLENQR